MYFLSGLIRHSLLILRCKLQGVNNRDGNVSFKNPYFPRNDTYCIINNDIKYIFTPKAVLITAFLVQDKKVILNYFLYLCPLSHVNPPPRTLLNLNRNAELKSFHLTVENVKQVNNITHPLKNLWEVKKI